MIKEIIKPDGDLRREMWRFTLNVGWTSSCIYFDHYSFQTRESTRHRKWVMQTHWTRFDHRNNNIADPPLPPDIENEMRAHYRASIWELAIQK